MRVVALISGGKDSCYNMMQCIAEGHEIVALANLRPKDKDELDSYMYQTVGHNAIDLYAEAMGVPLFRRTIEGSSVLRGKDYTETTDDEVEDLYALLKQVQGEISVQGVSVGAILSDYQRVRVEHVCYRLGLTGLGYLWRRDQEELLSEMIKCGVHAILIKVAALGLEPDKHLKKTLSDIHPHMVNMKAKYGLNVCGEGGEYETFTLDCPLFKKKIVVDEMDTVIHSDDAFAPVGYVTLKKIHLEKKSIGHPNIQAVLNSLPMQRSENISQELFSEEERNAMSVSTNTLSTAVCVNCIQNRIKRCYIQKSKSRNGWYHFAGIQALAVEGVSVEDSIRKALALLLEHVESVRLSASDLVAMHLYVQNMQNFTQINQVYKSYFRLNPPIRICVQAGLPDNVILQIDCIGYKSTDRKTMHVQSLSHWAPAYIGPYSQSVKINENIFIAGQIAMIPANLAVISGGILAESRLSLQHISRILDAMEKGSALQDLVLVVCYVTRQEFINVASAEWKKALEKSRNEATQSDVSYEEDVGADPIVQYVVTPALPDGAIVEWHVVATVNCRHRIGRGIQKRYEGYMTETTYITRRDSEQLLAFKILLELELVEPKTEEKIVKEYVEAVLSAVNDCISRANHNQVQYPALPALRIFYRQDIIGLQTLLEVYDELSRASEAVPCTSFIPAANFDSNNCVLSSSAILL